MSSDLRPQHPPISYQKLSRPAPALGFAEECSRQCHALADSPDHDLDAWLDTHNKELDAEITLAEAAAVRPRTAQ